jgi:hypothetical protein
MQFTLRRSRGIAAAALAAAVAAPAAAAAQDAAGSARAVTATVRSLLGTTSVVLADTGPLTAPGDARDASSAAGAVPSLLTASTLHAATVGGDDQVASEASLADLSLTIAGVRIGADFVMSRARAAGDGLRAGVTDVSGLDVNGIFIPVSGEPNQTIAIPGGRVVVNEQQTSAGGIVVNALRVVVPGVADVAIASSSAAVQ